MKNIHTPKLALIALSLCSLAACKKEQASQIDPVASLYSNTQVVSNAEYITIDSIKLHLDAYVPTARLGEPPWNQYSEQRKPTLLFLHGGGWRSGDKVSRSLFLMPYVSRGWAVVTANYRHLDQTSLVGIIRDSRSALNWIYDNANKYKFDTTKIVVSGESAGGHLALMTGLASDENLFSQGNIPSGRKLKVAAVVNWFGVCDLVKASAEWEADYLQEVVPNPSERDSILRVASPVNYLTKSSVPVMTIHGDQDSSAPYAQSVLLHDKLNSLGVKNFFLTIPGKKHGNFDGQEMTKIYHETWKFLNGVGVDVE